ncbi:beta strand repeat-containing protein [Patescibacteria group bacterium]
MKKLSIISGLILILVFSQAALANPLEAEAESEPTETEILSNDEHISDGPILTPEEEAIIYGEGTGEEKTSLSAASIGGGGGGAATRGLSGGCDTTTLSGALWVPYGQTCYVQNGSYTYDYILVSGYLVVGGTSSSTTLTADDGDITVTGSGARIYIGYTNGSNGKDALLRTTGSTYHDLKIMNGGWVFTRSNTYSGVDHYFSISGDIDITNDSDLDMWDNYNYNYANKLYVEDGSIVDISSGRLDVGNSTYIYDATSRINIDSGTELESNYLYMGQSDGSPVGGILNVDGTLDVIYNTHLYDSADLYCDGACASRLWQINDDAQVTNTGTFYQDNASYDLSMQDDSSLTNSGTVYVYGSLLMDDVGSGDSPTLSNTGLLDVNDDITMTDSSHITNGTVLANGTIDVKDDILMENNSQITNYYWIRQGYNGNVDATSTHLKMEDSALFHNADTTSYYYNYDSGSSTYGWAELFDSSEFRNQGNTDLHRLHVGNSVSDISGGTFNNEISGDLDVNQTGTSFNAILLYEGTINNKSGADDFDIDGQIQIEGTATEDGTLINSDNLARASNLYIIDHGILDNNAATFYVDGNGTAANGDITMNDESFIDNDGTLTVSDDLVMYTDAYIDNDGNFEGADVLVMNYGSFIDNHGGLMSFDTSATIYEGSFIENWSGADFETTTLYIGTSSSDPGTFANYGNLDSSTIYLYEDSGVGEEDDQYELLNYSLGYLEGNINIGDATNDGGELYNTAGDGILDGADPADEGIIGDISIYNGGNLYNGANRTGTLANANAEVNWQTTPASDIIIYPGGTVDNYALVGGDEIKDQNGTGTSLFQNHDDGEVESSFIKFQYFGEFNNGSSSETNATVDVDEIILTRYSVYNNYGESTTDELQMGLASQTGGQLDNEEDGNFYVTDTTSGAALIRDGGDINILSGSDAFEVAGQINIYAISTQATLNTSSGAGFTKFGNVTVGQLGLISIASAVEVDDSGGEDANLYIYGDATNEGKIEIVDGVSPTARLLVDGLTTIGDYGHLENNSTYSLTGSALGAFESRDLVTVNATGEISSDADSNFSFLEGIISNGTVDISDDLRTWDNSTSGYSIEVTGGTFTMGSSGATTAEDIMISGDGEMNNSNDTTFDEMFVYNDGEMHNYADIDGVWISVGDAESTAAGGELYNHGAIIDATINLSNSDEEAFKIYRGYTNNASGAEITVGSGDGGITIDGITTDHGIMDDYGTTDANINVGTYGEYNT